MANEKFIAVNGHNGEFVLGPRGHIAAHLENWKRKFSKRPPTLGCTFLEKIRVFRIPEDAEVSPVEFKTADNNAKVCANPTHR